MAGVQILHKRKVIDILDGDIKIGEIVFNPEDNRLYKRLLSLFREASEGDKLEKALTEKIAALDAIPEKIETTEDLESAAQAFSQIDAVFTVREDIFEKLCAGLNEAFGNGEDICNLFTGGDNDIELLWPIIEAVSPYFEAVRKEKMNQYKASHK